ncbi:MAG: hypothetical protein HYT78_03270 [Deltaproteobacteria bacterium]|nr:hypothetical protein [Deltaproteobacteria bacterium]
MSGSDTLRHRMVSGLLAGLLGGWVYGSFGSPHPWFGPAHHLFLNAGIGIGFGLFLGKLVTTAGSGLLWGEAYALIWWIVGPLTFFPFLLGNPPGWTVEAARSAFPMLLGYLVGYGTVLGLVYSYLSALFAGSWRARVLRQLTADFLFAVAIGGVAGLVGGLAFGAWMERVGIFPLIAGLVRSESADVGRTLHFIISVVIGASYGVLFRGDIQGIGSSIAWGLAYGFTWWVLGPLTIMPLWLGLGVQWSLAAGQAAFPSLVGHLIYGTLLGLVYSAVDRLWRVLFVESDPLKREPEGPGTRSLRAVGMGILASLAGGLAFTVVMVKTDALPVVASLIGRSSPTTGFVVHMVISAIIGATYGLLFRREAYTYGAGLAWGLVYGLVWWFLGPLTLMPILLGAEVQWSLASALGAYPSLIGHLAYGSATALAYQLLVMRYDPALRKGSRSVRTHLRRTSGTPAAALWVVVLMLGLMLPLLLTD